MGEYQTSDFDTPTSPTQIQHFLHEIRSLPKSLMLMRFFVFETHKT